MKKNLLFSLSVCSLLACRYQPASKPFPETNVFKVGDKLRVNLPENHTNSENWLLTGSTPQSITLLNAVWHGNQKGIDFNYEAKTAGVDTLRFILRRVNDTIATHQVIIRVQR